MEVILNSGSTRPSGSGETEDSALAGLVDFSDYFEESEQARRARSIAGLAIWTLDVYVRHRRAVKQNLREPSTNKRSR